MIGDDDDDPRMSPLASSSSELEPEVEEGQDNAASPTQLRRKASRKWLADKEGERFWKAVFADPIGRREMWRILQAGHCFEERFACGPNGFPQTEATWFEAGQQSLAQRLYQTWERMDRAGVFQMLDEFDPRFAKPPKPKKTSE